jgi:hypothetical protein
MYCLKIGSGRVDIGCLVFGGLGSGAAPVSFAVFRLEKVKPYYSLIVVGTLTSVRIVLVKTLVTGIPANCH